MTDDETDTCGHPTANGEPCQNPASDGDSCWLPAHGGSAESNGGAPSKFNDERAQDVLDAAETGVSQAGCARAAGVDEATLRDWLDKHAEFARAFARARARGEQELAVDALDGEVDSSMARFLLKTSFGYVETERREIDADVTHDGDLLAEFE